MLIEIALILSMIVIAVISFGLVRQLEFLKVFIRKEIGDRSQTNNSLIGFNEITKSLENRSSPNLPENSEVITRKLPNL